MWGETLRAGTNIIQYYKNNSIGQDDGLLGIVTMLLGSVRVVIGVSKLQLENEK